jgi:hypothetical protein
MAYFCFRTILALEGCLASCQFHNSDESHRSFQGARKSDLWGPSLHHVNGYWRVVSSVLRFSYSLNSALSFSQ